MRIRIGCSVLLVLATAVGLPRLAQAQDVEVTDEARAHFEAGLHYVDDPDGPRYEEAFREFQAAYAESPNWKILGNLGTCAFYLERDGEAIQAYERYLAEGGVRVPPEERQQIEKDLDTLKASAVWLTVSVEPPDATVVDERTPATRPAMVNRYTVLPTPTTLGIHPGYHRITVRTPGYQPATWEFEAKAGSRLSRSIRLERARPESTDQATPVEGESARLSGEPSASGSPPTAVYVALAGTGVLLAGGVVTGLWALSKAAEFDAANRAYRDDAASLRNQTKQLNLVADALLGASILAAAGTAYLYFSGDAGPQSPPEPAAAAVDLQGGIVPGRGWVAVTGNF